MISWFLSRVHRFKRNEDGNASVEFVLVAPLYLSIMMMSIELGTVTLTKTMLERGMDMAVRDIRLGTGTFDPDEAVRHAQIKKAICDNTLNLIWDCEANLWLQMNPADIRQASSIDTTVECTNKAVESDPVLDFKPGQQNELVLLRACLRYDPLFPEEFLGEKLISDGSDQAAIITTTAFVQEPL